ncbi:MAG: GAF domain-containing sensor histidine kinase, partial [Polyangiaceae bacterium]
MSRAADVDRADARVLDGRDAIEAGGLRARAKALAARETGPTSTRYEPFVHMPAVPLLLCDRDLRLYEMSKEALLELGLFERDRGRTLHALADRIPGATELVHAARRALSSKATHELSIRCAQRAFLARVSAFAHPDGGGVAIVLTDVTALEAAKARALTQQRQQAAVARVSALALSPLPQSEVFEEGLSVLFGNIPLCSAGVILERLDARSQRVLAARGFGARPLEALRELGDEAELVQAAVQRGRLVVHGADAGASRLISGVVCPIVHDGDVLGVIALYSRQPGIDAPDHEHFMQAVANVLGGALVRHRTRRRLALELEVGNTLASAPDIAASVSGLARALRRVMPHERVELWLAGTSSPGTWVRHCPSCDSELDDTFSPDEVAAVAGPRYQGADTEGKPHALTLGVRSGGSAVALLRVLGRELRAPDPELCAGLARVASMLGDFLARLEMLRSLQASEARYRQHSAELESLYAELQRGEANLREIDRQKDDFLAMLGHELRNPMAAIRNATELLGQVESGQPRVERLHSVFERQTQQMMKLVDGLLDVSRVARGKVELTLAPVNVCDLSRQVVEDRRPEFYDRRVELRLPAEELWALADRSRVVQILDNLLSNACKFTSPRGHVVIEVGQTDSSGS